MLAGVFRSSRAAIEGRTATGRRGSLLAACGLAASLSIGATAAHAATPNSSNKRIVPGKSIAGVKLGATYTDVQNRWGTGNSCAEAAANAAAQGLPPRDPATYNGQCNWAVPLPAGVVVNQGGAAVTFANGKATELMIYARRKASGTPVASGPIAKFKTDRGGLSVGDRVGKFRKAYPKAKPTVDGEYVLKSGGRQTVFDVLSDRVFSITISAK